MAAKRERELRVAILSLVAPIEADCDLMIGDGRYRYLATPILGHENQRTATSSSVKAVQTLTIAIIAAVKIKAA